MTVSDVQCPPQLRLWLTQAVQQGASDLHLVADHPPVIRLHGVMQPLDLPPQPPDALRTALLAVLREEQQVLLEEQKNLDFSLSIRMGDGPQRFRSNYFFTGRAIGACFRIIPASIPDFAWAGFPPDVADKLIGYRNGLVLFSGVTGSGKTTSLAMIINRINFQGGVRIITVEEPIEYQFPHASGSLVTQREVGVDIANFSDGLKYGLRQDPDVILVGEIRDPETARMALSAAETGHLVFSTLHTRDAKGAISRFADLFPQDARGAVLSQMAMSLRAVISQHLLPNIDVTAKRELALEVMYNTTPVAAAIRLDRIESIDNSILTGRADGMLPLAESVKRLLQAGRITRATAERFVSDPQALYR